MSAAYPVLSNHSNIIARSSLWARFARDSLKFQKRRQLVDKREKRGCTAASGQLHHRVNRPDGKRRHVIGVYNFSFARNHEASRAVIHFPRM
jgi:hypothetical protein